MQICFNRRVDATPNELSNHHSHQKTLQNLNARSISDEPSFLRKTTLGDAYLECKISNFKVNRPTLVNSVERLR
jgi:hypothetical protein